jgi:uncharacterized membrane protein
LKAASPQEAKVRRWTDAGIIDAATGARILDFESAHDERTGLNWPVVIAMLFGGILLAAGITLFVAAHWDQLSPAARFSLVLLMVAVFHAGGALVSEKFPALSTTLHGVGTATLGAAIFLSAQIFNLNENWATGILLWALGAAAGYWLLRDWVQAALVAILVPAWLIGEWDVATLHRHGGVFAVNLGLITTALCYLSARIGEEDSSVRRMLVWIGGLTLIPCLGNGVFSSGEDYYYAGSHAQSLGTGTLVLAWIVAIAAPLLVAVWFRRQAAWLNVVAALWTVALLSIARNFRPFRYGEEFTQKLSLYGMMLVGSVALVAWGLRENRRERVNLGVALFAISILFFYFDGFMGKLDRAASLLLLGAICLAGGYALEITRRRLVARMEPRP